MPEFRYKAFISYSWADAAWGKWLHHAIETYRTPRPLIGEDGLYGPVAARLIPLFKDREEEAAGSSIGASVESALSSSEFMIVICSPNSAKSRWVNHEVAWFKAHRDPDKILALIIDGEPGHALNECFPKALTHLVGPDQTITDQLLDAPLAADARKTGDGKRGARLKLVAAMLGVGLDVLVRRDDRRRVLRQRLVSAGSLLFGGAMAGLAWFAVEARDEARDQRGKADGLVEFMLTDLREKLEPVGRLDAMDVVGQKALVYYGAQDLAELDADALGRRSRALHLVGEVRDTRGDSVAALEAFREAARTTGELLARDPENGQRIFDHAQSVYWAGFIAYQRGEIREAEGNFRAYDRLAEQLAAIDPGNADWQMEVSYAKSNLGTLLFEQGRYAEAESAFTRALEVVARASRNDPTDPAKQVDHAQAISWLGITLEQQERIEPALAQYGQEIAIYDGLLAKEPGNARALSSKATALAGIGRLEVLRGQKSAAIAAFDQAIAINEALRRLEPGNGLRRQYEINNRTSRALALFLFGDLAAAQRELGTLQDLQVALAGKDPKNAIWNIDARAPLEDLAARLDLAAGRDRSALVHALTATRLVGLSRLRDDPRMRVVAGSAWLIVGDIYARLGNAALARETWLAASNATDNHPAAALGSMVMVRFAAARRLGLTAQSEQLRASLAVRSWRHPQFLNELRRSARINRSRSSGQR